MSRKAADGPVRAVIGRHSKVAGSQIMRCLAAGLTEGIMLFALAAAGWAQPIIVDHRHTDLAKVPVQWIKQAKSALRVAYQHTSHGSQLVTGIQALSCRPRVALLLHFDAVRLQLGVFLNDYGISGASDLGNPNFTEWYNATRNLLNRTGGCDRNVVMWSWCGQVSGATSVNIDTYLGLDEPARDGVPGRPVRLHHRPSRRHRASAAT